MTATVATLTYASRARRLTTRASSAGARGMFERSVPVVAASVQAKLQTSTAPNAKSVAARILAIRRNSPAVAAVALTTQKSLIDTHQD